MWGISRKSFWNYCIWNLWRAGNLSFRFFFFFYLPFPISKSLPHRALTPCCSYPIKANRFWYSLQLRIERQPFTTPIPTWQMPEDKLMYFCKDNHILPTSHDWDCHYWMYGGPPPSTNIPQFWENREVNWKEIQWGPQPPHSSSLIVVQIISILSGIRHYL